MVKAAALIGTTPVDLAKVTVNEHRVVGGGGTAFDGVTAGPTTVTSDDPWASLASTLSPSMASHGWAAVAVTIRPTGTEAFGNQLGSPPLLADPPESEATIPIDSAAAPATARAATQIRRRLSNRVS